MHEQSQLPLALLWGVANSRTLRAPGVNEQIRMVAGAAEVLYAEEVWLRGSATIRIC
jgi:hypothetical protein